MCSFWQLCDHTDIPHNKSLKVSESGKELFCILEVGSIKEGGGGEDKISKSERGTERRGPKFFEKNGGGNLPRRTLRVHLIYDQIVTSCKDLVNSQIQNPSYFVGVFRYSSNQRNQWAYRQM